MSRHQQASWCSPKRAVPPSLIFLVEVDEVSSAGGGGREREREREREKERGQVCVLIMHKYVHCDVDSGESSRKHIQLCLHVKT